MPLPPIRASEVFIGIMVSRIELDGAPQPCNCLFPMPKPALDKGGRFNDFSIIRETLLSLLKFRERPEVGALPVTIITNSQMSFRSVRVKSDRMIGCILKQC